MDIEKPNCIGCHHIHPDNGNCTAVGGFCTAVPAAHCPLIPELRAENERLREQVRQLETRARTERCDTADYDCRELGALRREVSSLRERLAADEWIDPAVELPPNDDMVLTIYELASYGSEGWIVEQFELWETPTVTWWRPLPDPPEKKKEER